MSLGKSGEEKRRQRVSETQEIPENSWQVLLCDMLAHQWRENEHEQNLSVSGLGHQVSDQFNLVL